MNFFKKTQPPDAIRSHNRELRKAQRDIQRNKLDLEKQEKQLELEIKKAAREGNKQAVNILAKQLVNFRKEKGRMAVANSHITTIVNQSKITQANNKLANALTTTTKALKQTNKATSPANIMKTIKGFEKENTKMQMMDEMIEDTISSALDISEDEEEEKAVIDKVLDEIGIELKGKLAEVPTPGKGFEKPESSKSQEELEAQLARLGL